MLRLILLAMTKSTTSCSHTDNARNSPGEVEEVTTKLTTSASSLLTQPEVSTPITTPLLPLHGEGAQRATAFTEQSGPLSSLPSSSAPDRGFLFGNGSGPLPSTSYLIARASCSAMGAAVFQVFRLPHLLIVRAFCSATEASFLTAVRSQTISTRLKPIPTPAPSCLVHLHRAFRFHRTLLKQEVFTRKAFTTSRNKMKFLDPRSKN
jgi:hypothetical protein